MWPRRSHILALLTNPTGKDTFIWTSIHQQTFDAMKALMVEGVLLHILTIISHFIYVLMHLTIS